ncbi:Bug family tripartite tricarboxylate transporter substrate binding protein [Salipiger profundus]|uniref:Bug family tripartite tricarboxylate transporter substrate binding protein n=1 Tax=Salipiger profundus TaxID=1229727 RepID=UPI0008F27DB4|nr:tripartite tricarboxylate transporter substrate binding protein [Salipiger profundus]SFD94450.1 Tripartite-type tricarboxylate transporter, receptor component TctC [Salipiger profundus]
MYTKRTNNKSFTKLTSAFLIGALGLTLPAVANAQENFPNRAITMVVGYGAGGGTDTQTRLTAQYLEEQLGVPVTVQNMPGAGSQVAAASVLRTDADGYTILATNQPDLSITIAVGNAPYKLTDFDLLAVDIYEPRILMVSKDAPFEDFSDFVEMAKAEPGKLSLSVTSGGAQEQFARWLVRALDIDVRIVGYSSGSETTSAVMGGHVTGTIGDDFARFNMRDESKALLIGSDDVSPRWPEAEPMTKALAPFGVVPPVPDYLARYQVYAVPASVKANYPERFEILQEALVALSDDREYQNVVKARGFEDLSLMAPAEGYSAIFESTLNALLSSKSN